MLPGSASLIRYPSSLSLSLRGRHVPFRDSRLTHALASSLCAGSKALMVACVSPADADAAETLCSLQVPRHERAEAALPRMRGNAAANLLESRSRLYVGRNAVASLLL